MPDFLAAAGPIWGPDFVTVTVTQDGREYDVEVFPDANNPELRDAGLPTQYYWQPKAVNVARRQDDPADFDFGMTVFKGLMTSDRDVAVTSADQEAGGGWLTFSTTFGLPKRTGNVVFARLLGAEGWGQMNHYVLILGFDLPIPVDYLSLVPAGAQVTPIGLYSPINLGP